MHYTIGELSPLTTQQPFPHLVLKSGTATPAPRWKLNWWDGWLRGDQFPMVTRKLGVSFPPTKVPLMEAKARINKVRGCIILNGIESVRWINKN